MNDLTLIDVVKIYYKKRVDGLNNIRLGAIIKNNPQTESYTATAKIPITFTNVSENYDLYYSPYNALNYGKALRFIARPFNGRLVSAVDASELTFEFSDEVLYAGKGAVIDIEGEQCTIASVNSANKRIVTVFERGAHGTAANVHIEDTQVVLYTPNIPYNYIQVDAYYSVLPAPVDVEVQGQTEKFYVKWTWNGSDQQKKFFDTYRVYYSKTNPVTKNDSSFVSIGTDAYFTPRSGISAMPDLEGEYYFAVDVTDKFGNESVLSSQVGPRKMFASVMPSPDGPPTPVVSISGSERWAIATVARKATGGTHSGDAVANVKHCVFEIYKADEGLGVPTTGTVDGNQTQIYTVNDESLPYEVRLGVSSYGYGDYWARARFVDELDQLSDWGLSTVFLLDEKSNTSDTGVPANIIHDNDFTAVYSTGDNQYQYDVLIGAEAQINSETVFQRHMMWRPYEGAGVNFNPSVGFTGSKISQIVAQHRTYNLSLPGSIPKWEYTLALENVYGLSTFTTPETVVLSGAGTFTAETDVGTIDWFKCYTAETEPTISGDGCEFEFSMGSNNQTTFWVVVQGTKTAGSWPTETVSYNQTNGTLTCNPGEYTATLSGVSGIITGALVGKWLRCGRLQGAHNPLQEFIITANTGGNPCTITVGAHHKFAGDVTPAYWSIIDAPFRTKSDYYVEIPADFSSGSGTYLATVKDKVFRVVGGPKDMQFRALAQNQFGRGDWRYANDSGGSVNSGDAKTYRILGLQQGDTAPQDINRYNEVFEYTPKNLITYNTAGSIAIVSGVGETGGNVLAATGKTGRVFNGRIPYDQNTLYEMTARVKRSSGTSTGVEIGIQALSATGTVLGTYKICANNSSFNSGSWTVFTGYAQGIGTPSGEPASSPLSPSPMPSGTKYFRPFWLLNSNATSGTMQIDFVRVHEASLTVVDAAKRALQGLNTDGTVKPDMAPSTAIGDKRLKISAITGAKVKDVTHNSCTIEGGTVYFVDTGSSNFNETSFSNLAESSGHYVYFVLGNGTLLTTTSVTTFATDPTYIPIGVLSTPANSDGRITFMPFNQLGSVAIAADRIFTKNLAAISAELGRIRAGEIAAGSYIILENGADIKLASHDTNAARIEFGEWTAGTPPTFTEKFYMYAPKTSGIAGVYFLPVDNNTTDGSGWFKFGNAVDSYRLYNFQVNSTTIWLRSQGPNANSKGSFEIGPYESTWVGIATAKVLTVKNDPVNELFSVAYDASPSIKFSVGKTAITHNVNTTINGNLIVTGTTTFGTRAYTWSNAALVNNTYLKHTSSGNVSWVEASDVLGSHTHSLAGLSDTTISAPSSGQFLRHNGSVWVNQTVAVATYGTLGSGYIPKATDATGALGNSVIYESGGNIGIGTISPQSLFEVSTAGNVAVNIRNSTESVNGTAALAFRTGSGANAATNYIAGIDGIITQDDPDALKGALRFYANAGDSVSERMRLSSGGLGIGTTNPTSALQVHGAVRVVAPSGDNTYFVGSSSTSYNYFTLNDNAGYTYISWFARLVNGAWESTHATVKAASIVGTASGIHFRIGTVTGIGNNPEFVDAVRINTTGLSIGTTAVSHGLTISSSVALDVAQDDFITNKTVGLIYSTGSGGSAAPFTARGNLIIQPRTSSGMGIYLATGGTTPTIRVAIASGGNVGIGITSPAYLLDVNGILNVASQTRFNSQLYTWPNNSPANNCLVLGAGGVLGWALIDTANIANNAITSDKIQSAAVVSSKLVKSAQAFVMNIYWDSSNYQNVNWQSGSIKLGDGTVLSITGGSHTLTNTSLTYIYWSPDYPTTFQKSTTYSDAVNDDNLLVCVAKQGVDHANGRAFFVPAMGELRINAAHINTITLSALSADLGTVTAGILQGATVRTHASGARIELNSDSGDTGGFRAIDSSGNTRVQIPVTGSEIVFRQATAPDGTGAGLIKFGAGANIFALSDTIYLWPVVKVGLTTLNAASPVIRGYNASYADPATAELRAATDDIEFPSSNTYASVKSYAGTTAWNGTSYPTVLIDVGKGATSYASIWVTKNTDAENGTIDLKATGGKINITTSEFTVTASIRSGNGAQTIGNSTTGWDRVYTSNIYQASTQYLNFNSSTITAYQNIIPNNNKSQDLGSSSKYWNTVFLAALRGDGTETNWADAISIKDAAGTTKAILGRTTGNTYNYGLAVGATTSEYGFVWCGNKSSGDPTTPGCVILLATDGTPLYLWSDTSGKLRCATSWGHSNYNTAGTVVGTQS